MPLFSDNEIREMRERTTARMLAERQSNPRPKTKREILVDLVRKDPTLTVNELSEGSGHSKSWVRKHLRAAGLKAAPAQRQRNSEPVEAAQ